MFAAITSLLAGQAVGKLRERVRPNPYAPTLVDQSAIAVTQAGQLRPGTSGMAGSEYDYYMNPQGPQGVDSMGWVPVSQDITSWRRPDCQFLPGDPGADPSDPTVLADVRRGPVRLDTKPYGVTMAQPHSLTARINPPTRTTPLPRDVAAARATGAPQGEQDAFNGLFDG